MAIVQNILLPIGQLSLYFVFGGLAVFGLYSFFKMIFPKPFGVWVKYKILRKEYPEKEVAWCDAAFESGADLIDVEVHLKLEGHSNQRIQETLFIFKEIIKLKGGEVKNYGRQIKKSTFKDFTKEGRTKTKSERKI